MRVFKKYATYTSHNLTLSELILSRFFCDTNVPNKKANHLQNSSAYTDTQNQVTFTEVVQAEYRDLH